jgi:hypothetical protein
MRRFSQRVMSMAMLLAVHNLSGDAATNFAACLIYGRVSLRHA